jgi:RNA polymerase-binding transcription factor DksA
MPQTRQVVAAKKKLMLRRHALSRSCAENDAGAVELADETRPDDVAQNVELVDVLVLLSARGTVALRDIDAALSRIERGTWGRCERCGESISRSRLAALPEARACASCAS